MTDKQRIKQIRTDLIDIARKHLTPKQVEEVFCTSRATLYRSIKKDKKQ